MSPSDGTLSGRQPKAVQSALRVLEEVARAGVGVTAKETGKLLLAEKQDVAGFVPVSEDLPRQLDVVREQGYATQTGELREDCACIAVAVRAPDGALVAALAMSGRAEQDELLQRQIPTLAEYAKRLSPLLA
jgi:DNA-binding IclR family transcriptional regulator